MAEQLAEFDFSVPMEIYEDEDISKEFVGKFVSMTFHRGGLLDTIIKLYTDKNWADLKRESHSLKGRARGVGLLQFGDIASHLQDAAGSGDENEINKFMQLMLDKAVSSHNFLHNFLAYGDEDVIFSYEKSMFPSQSSKSQVNTEILNPEEEKVRVRNMEMFYHAIYSRNGILRRLITNFKKTNRSQFRTNINYLLERGDGLDLKKIEELSKALLSKLDESVDMKNNEELAKYFKQFVEENKSTASYIRENILKRKNTEFDDYFWGEKIVPEECEEEEKEYEEAEEKKTIAKNTKRNLNDNKTSFDLLDENTHLRNTNYRIRALIGLQIAGEKISRMIIDKKKPYPHLVIKTSKKRHDGCNLYNVKSNMNGSDYPFDRGIKCNIF